MTKELAMRLLEKNDVYLTKEGRALLVQLTSVKEGGTSSCGDQQ